MLTSVIECESCTNVSYIRIPNTWGIYTVSCQCAYIGGIYTVSCLAYIGQKCALKLHMKDHEGYFRNQYYNSSPVQHSWR